MYEHGILAVGLLGGKVMLVDLNMDEAAESSETSPGGLMYLNPSSRDVARFRRKTLIEGSHIWIGLNIVNCKSVHDLTGNIHTVLYCVSTLLMIKFEKSPFYGKTRSIFLT